MKQYYRNLLLSIEKEEKEVSRSKKSIIDEAYHMVSFLDRTLIDLKEKTVSNGFESIMEEIGFFKNVKPHILGKLIYYNKIVRIESSSPTNTDLTDAYYTEQIKVLNKEYKKHVTGSDFYSYYRAGRTDKDDYFFRLGKINYFDSINSFYFEVDRDFSTFYDYKVARIISYELLQLYLSSKFTKHSFSENTFVAINEDAEFSWTDSKNALIELIYALHISRSVSNGKIGLRRISEMFEDIFEVNLGDIHHAFYQMKFRGGQRARYLHHLKSSLEQYMDNEL